jgi:hypothetical protein
MASNLTVETVLLITVGVAVLGIINLCGLFFVHKKIQRLLGGKTQAADIESAQVLINADLNELKQFRAELERYLETVELRLKRSVQGVETLRFNPFKGNGDGGNQSFSTAFINEHGDGVVVSSLYSRERISIFSKALKNFNSEFELTEEEKHVIENGRKKLTK